MESSTSPCPLIGVKQLQRLLADNPVIVDCRFDLMQTDAGYQAYLQGHIPGAYYAHLDRDLAGPVDAHTGRHPLPTTAVFHETLRRWGITREKIVVVYDEQTGMFASRLWWMLARWLNFANVLLLDGGYNSWLQQTGVSSKDIPEQFLLSSGSPLLQANSNCYLDTESIVKNLDTEFYTLVDVRDPQRYAGLHEPIDPVAGHIPGAINIPLTTNLDNGHFKSPEALRLAYRQILHSPDEHLVLMCGSGVSACHSLFALELIGKSGALLYPGSWSEWIRNPAHPINTSSLPK